MFKKTSIFLLTYLIISLPALAENRPHGYPDFFEHSGIINSINLESGLINIGDIPLYVIPGVVVHTPTGRYMTLENLRPGNNVGCKLHKSSNGNTIINELWLLPKGSLPLKLPRH
ncbi:hypothetical protein MNBD_GAMMA14-835 [hydrothermal vent metagenome]|uniref:Uncharacterized protein n=1 Tax=hydrothermal vent metagenome TaxID=652676 RepID=A0A3B0Y9P2_9ZZZZ